THDAAPALTQREFLDAFAELLGVRLRRVPVPAFIARWGTRAWTRWRRLRDPTRYTGVAGAAVSFLLGENPYDAGRIRAELGWTPPLGTREGIRRTVAWYAGNKEEARA
ncbi:MAG: hypothetical protein ACREME_04845, partial [Gemmatimonadales bacterium]